jgi:acyl carrier protein
VTSVFEQITRMVRDVVGEDYLLDVQITAGTTFTEDLGLESIEFVELWEKVQEHYGPRVNITAFIADMDIDAIMGITVGQLAGYIEAQLATPV